MATNPVNIGARPNDRQGDNLRTAIDKLQKQINEFNDPLLVGAIGYTLTHTFPEAYGNVGMQVHTDVNGDSFAVRLSYSETTAGSVDIFNETAPGVFAATPTQELSVSRPRGVVFHNIPGVATLMFITSNINNSYVIASEYYDSPSLMFWKPFGEVDFRTPPYQTFNTHGAVLPKFYTDTVLNKTFLTIPNSVSSSQNLSGGTVYNNCYRQSIEVWEFVSIGSGFTLYQEIANTKGVYAAPMIRSQLGLVIFEIPYYDDGGTNSSTPGYESVARGLLWKDSTNKFGTMAAPDWTFGAKGGGDGVLFVTNAGTINENTYLVTTCQRDMSSDVTAYPDDDVDHFSNNVFWYRLNTKGAPNAKCSPSAMMEPIKGAYVQNDNSVRVTADLIFDHLVIGFSNSNTGGGGGGNAFFNQGNVTLYRWDVATELPVALVRVPSRGAYDHCLYIRSGDVYLATAEFGEDVDARGDLQNYTITSRHWKIGALNFIGPQGSIGPSGAVGAGYAATSATSLTVGLGTKAAVTQAGLAYTVGARVRYTSTANTANWMEGLVTAYSGTSLTINADLTNGSGTVASWSINLAGQPGSGSSVADNLIIAGPSSGGPAAAAGRTLSSILDSVIGSTRGNLITRGASGWTVLAPGTSGNVLQTNGAGSDVTWAVPSTQTEGTWTPTLYGATTAGTPIYTGQTGRWSRFGNEMTVWCTVSVSGWTVNPAGGMRIGGLPVAVRTGVGVNFPAFCIPLNNITLAAGFFFLYARPDTASTVLGLVKTGANTPAFLDAADIGTGTMGFQAQCTYLV